MKAFKKIGLILGVLSIAILWCSNALATSVVSVGDEFPQLNVTSQFDKAFSIDATTKRVLFSASKPASNLVGDFLETRTPDWLSQASTLYVADIHKMPRMITRMVALPKMKKLSYDIFLGRTAGALSQLPAQEGCVTIIDVAALKLANIRYACDADSLNQILLNASE